MSQINPNASQANPNGATSPTIEQLLAENEQLRQERRLLLKALYPPVPEEEVDVSDYFPVTADDLIEAAHTPVVK